VFVEKEFVQNEVVNIWAHSLPKMLWREMHPEISQVMIISLLDMSLVLDSDMSGSLINSLAYSSTN
jgi:hypothetical protein